MFFGDFTHRYSLVQYFQRFEVLIQFYFSEANFPLSGNTEVLGLCKFIALNVRDDLPKLSNLFPGLGIYPIDFLCAVSVCTLCFPLLFVHCDPFNGLRIYVCAIMKLQCYFFASHVFQIWNFAASNGVWHWIL